MKPIDRRTILQAIGATPLIALRPADAAAQVSAATPNAAPYAPPAKPVGAAEPAPPAEDEPAIPTTLATKRAEQVGAEFRPTFFSAAQFATLRTLAEVLMPALNGFPGAIEAGAPEFIDFYVGRSSPDPVGRAELRTWYRTGLDDLDARARRAFGTSFAQLSAQQIGELITPMFQRIGAGRQSVSVFHRLPFMNEVRFEVRNATINSPAWAAATERAGQRLAAALYWRRVDPTVLERD
jgi:hypothetical protein